MRRIAIAATFSLALAISAPANATPALAAGVAIGVGGYLGYVAGATYSIWKGWRGIRKSNLEDHAIFAGIH